MCTSFYAICIASRLEYDGVHLWLAALLRISLGMFPASDYLRFREEVHGSNEMI